MSDSFILHSLMRSFFLKGKLNDLIQTTKKKSLRITQFYTFYKTWIRKKFFNDIFFSGGFGFYPQALEHGIPKGTDDNGELMHGLVLESVPISLISECFSSFSRRGQKDLCWRSQLGDPRATAKGIFRKVRSCRGRQPQDGRHHGKVEVLRFRRL